MTRGIRGPNSAEDDCSFENEELFEEMETELVAKVEEAVDADVPYSEARRRVLMAFERRYVERMLVVHRGNVTRAAAASGLARRNFQLIRARRRDEA
jgi:hypothetical protein